MPEWKIVEVSGFSYEGELPGDRVTLSAQEGQEGLLVIERSNLLRESLYISDFLFVPQLTEFDMEIKNTSRMLQSGISYRKPQAKDREI